MKRARGESAPNSVVALNVGGRIHTFNRQTLAASPPGLLLRLFGHDADRFGGATVTDEAGRPFIDWDGDAFGVVASLLRANRALVPPGVDVESARTTLAYFFDDELVPISCGAERFSRTVTARLLQGIIDEVHRVFRVAAANYLDVPHASPDKDATYLRCGIVHRPRHIAGVVLRNNTPSLVIDLELELAPDAERGKVVVGAVATSVFNGNSNIMDTVANNGGTARYATRSCAVPLLGEHAAKVTRHLIDVHRGVYAASQYSLGDVHDWLVGAAQAENATLVLMDKVNNPTDWVSTYRQMARVDVTWYFDETAIRKICA